jgi:DNA-directed RNA polymerase subunit RPC12/RpoP
MKCPYCHGRPGLLGALGRTKHYRCIDCGGQWSRAARAKKIPQPPKAPA